MYRNPEAQADALFAEWQVVWAGIENASWEESSRQHAGEIHKADICAARRFSSHEPHVATLN